MGPIFWDTQGKCWGDEDLDPVCLRGAAAPPPPRRAQGPRARRCRRWARAQCRCQARAQCRCRARAHCRQRARALYRHRAQAQCLCRARALCRHRARQPQSLARQAQACHLRSQQQQCWQRGLLQLSQRHFRGRSFAEPMPVGPDFESAMLKKRPWGGAKDAPGWGSRAPAPKECTT